jgi:hypothetical protein
MIGNIHLQLEITKEVLHDVRLLAPHEETSRQLVKLKTLGLSSVQRNMARQESRLLRLREGDASTIFFSRPCQRWRRKNHIRSLVHEGRVLVSQESTAKVGFSYFDSMTGTPPVHSNLICLKLLGLSHLDPTGMGEWFTEEEVWSIIRSLPLYKAPVSDGFTSQFLHVAWKIIRPDLMAASEVFWRLDTRDLHATNDALMIMLLKSVEAAAIKDYRQISLILVVCKLISKILVNQLDPKIGSLGSWESKCFY